MLAIALWRRGFGLDGSRASRYPPVRRRPKPVQSPVFISGVKKRKVVEEKGIEPSTPTLRTWCSPS